jgi:mannose-6-phosphate isomerase-like protein (cupin superfamily)
MSAENLKYPRVLHVPPEGGDKFSVYGDLDNIKLKDGESRGALSVVEAQVPPHLGPPPHIHHKEHETVYVLDGEVDILDGDRWFRVQERGMVFMPMESLHAFRNPHDEPGKVMLIFTPAGFEDYLKKVGEMVAAGDVTSENDVESVIPLAATYGMEILPEDVAPKPPQE